MATITEDYCDFETAKLLKEKGFDQNCATYYLDGQVWRHYHGEVIPKGKQIYAALTQAIAMKWLREVHNIYIFVYSFNRELPITENTFYTCDVATTKDSPMRGHLRGIWKTYEETVEAAIKYVLENLI